MKTKNMTPVQLNAPSLRTLLYTSPSTTPTLVIGNHFLPVYKLGKDCYNFPLDLVLVEPQHRVHKYSVMEDPDLDLDLDPVAWQSS